MEHNKALIQAIIDRMKTVLGVESDREVAQGMGVSRSTLGVWKKRGSIPYQQLVDFAVANNLSLDWVLLGRGRPELTSVEAELGSHEALYVEIPAYEATGMFTAAPLLSWTMPRTWMEQEGLSDADTIIVRAAGDTMASTLKDGQLVIVDRRPRDMDGIYLVRSGDSVRFRRLQRMLDGSIRLSCDNPAYAAEMISPGEAASLQLVGYCHAVIALLR